jgi:hypothetical protein
METLYWYYDKYDQMYYVQDAIGCLVFYCKTLKELEPLAERHILEEREPVK